MAVRASTVLLTVANLLIPIAILIFATGFFPYKPFVPGLAKYEEVGFKKTPEAPFDKLVFMVVDALRRYGTLGTAIGWPKLILDVVILFSLRILGSSLRKGTLWVFYRYHYKHETN
jgi:hypothetical protein